MDAIETRRSGHQILLEIKSGLFLWLGLTSFILEQRLGFGESALMERLIVNKVYISDGYAMSAGEPGW